MQRRDCRRLGRERRSPAPHPCGPGAVEFTAIPGVSVNAPTFDSKKIPMPAILNVLGTPLETCSADPLTGYFRDGLCNTCTEDVGEHTICVEMNEEFLLFARARGNDLLAPRLEVGFPGLLPGDRWCVCLPRWIEAFEAGVVARVHLRATHQEVTDSVPLAILEQVAYHDG